MKANNDMPIDQAKKINGRLVEAYLCIDMGYPASTDLSDISMTDAMTATEVMRAYPGDQHPDGSKTCYVVLDDRCIPTLAPYLAQPFA